MASISETRSERTAKFIRGELEGRLKTIETGLVDEAWGGVQVVTNRDLQETFALPLPEPNEHAAEVTTPGFLTVLGICPLCSQGVYLRADLSTKLVVDSKSRTLKLAAKSDGVNHVCGQQILRDVTPEVEGQEALELDDAVAAAAVAWEEDICGNASCQHYRRVHTWRAGLEGYCTSPTCDCMAFIGLAVAPGPSDEPTGDAGDEAETPFDSDLLPEDGIAVHGDGETVQEPRRRAGRR